MEENEEKRSQVLQLLDLVWQNTNTTAGHSYERLNHAMQRAVSLAIGSGFKFEEDDMQNISKNYRSSYWFDQETAYTQAVNSNNQSAAVSFEKWKSRAPFIADDVSYEYSRGTWLHGGGTRKRDRLAIGCTFRWQGYPVKVTSFSGTRVVACSYKKTDDGHSTFSGNVDKIFKITREDIIADRAERKERYEIDAALVKLGKGRVALAELGVKTRDEFERIPIKRLRLVAKSFGVEIKPRRQDEKNTSDE